MRCAHWHSFVFLTFFLVVIVSCSFHNQTSSSLHDGQTSKSFCTIFITLHSRCIRAVRLLFSVRVWFASPRAAATLGLSEILLSFPSVHECGLQHPWLSPSSLQCANRERKKKSARISRRVPQEPSGSSRKR